ncbi:hypothetical protein A9Q99_15640 [Gammaproteobacteria bacterium 45_16_T64]|nr:hypothetical protein A9Q99_15640 [Gammaproteobacteria bacterium 45_16_T64]
MRRTPLPIDLKAFANDIDDLRQQLKHDTGPKDLAHFKKIEITVWLLAFIGLSTAWLGPNPIAIFALAAASFARWTILSHHISHRGYENIPGAPARYQSKTYARGWRRLIHWMDWVHPDAWHHEHDVMHHYNLGETGDPDVPQNNAGWIRDSRLPAPIKLLIVTLIAIVWKPIYYAPNTLNSLLNKQEKTSYELGSWDLWSPFKKRFWLIIWRCWLPYISFRFVFLPGLFLLISPEAALYALVNLLIAEVVINLWSYIVIVPNHAGSDIYVFDQHPSDRANFYLNQILGSVDYHCGGNTRDFMHGWLNYQVEHHLFPDMTARQYQMAHKRIREICEKHNVPVVSESVFKRVGKLTKILIGTETQPLWPGIVDTSITAPQPLANA